MPKETTPGKSIQPLMENGSAQQPGSSVIQDISGSWQDPEGAILLLRQDGSNRFTIEVYHDGTLTGQGTGYVQDRKVDMNINFANMAMVVISATLSPDGRQMDGALTATANGNTNTIQTRLIRQNN
jgi:hypothetical protein